MNCEAAEIPLDVARSKIVGRTVIGVNLPEGHEGVRRREGCRQKKNFLLKWRVAGTSECKVKYSKVKQDICIAPYSECDTHLYFKCSGMARVSDGSHSFTCHPNVCPRMNWAILPLLASRRASPHFGWYSFFVQLRVGGWVGLGGWLYNEVTEDGHLSHDIIIVHRVTRRETELSRARWNCWQIPAVQRTTPLESVYESRCTNPVNLPGSTGSV